MARLKKRKTTGGSSVVDRFVLDCSVVLAWYFADEADPYADLIATRLGRSEAIVPSHWPLEVANTLIMGERRKRSTESQANAFLHFLRSLPIVVDDATAAQAWSATMIHARGQSLTVYDAAYLELSRRRGVPLATLDTRLRTAAGAVGIPFFEPAESE